MEQYRQITFKQAMEMIEEDKLDLLYFKKSRGIDNVMGWQVQMDKLIDEKWYIKEQIK